MVKFEAPRGRITRNSNPIIRGVPKKPTFPTTRPESTPAATLAPKVILTAVKKVTLTPKESNPKEVKKTAITLPSTKVDPAALSKSKKTATTLPATSASSAPVPIQKTASSPPKKDISHIQSLPVKEIEKPLSPPPQNTARNVQRLARPNPVTIPPNTTLSERIRLYNNEKVDEFENGLTREDINHICCMNIECDLTKIPPGPLVISQYSTMSYPHKKHSKW